ncbi:hypothetical protein, partial [Streptomyces griseus]|uniref:hypothetical protein n=1 Tax=Streptomyces griseus TaxID=1911 RepID=UPI003497B198
MPDEAQSAAAPQPDKPVAAPATPEKARSRTRLIYALTFIQSSENKTVPVGVLTELVRGDVFEWGSLMAGALFGSLPV